MSFSKKKTPQINVNPEVNISNTIEERKMQLEGTDINKNNNKYRKDNFESFIFNLVREFDITINAAVSSSN